MISIYTIPTLLDELIENAGRVAGHLFKAVKVQSARLARSLNKTRNWRYVGYLVLAITLILPMTLVNASSSSPVTTVAAVQTGTGSSIQAFTPQVVEVAAVQRVNIEVTTSSPYLEAQAQKAKAEAAAQAAAAAAKKAATATVAMHSKMDILSAIRTCESRNDYRAQNRYSSASGAYQFLDSTWAHFGGYARAKDAPAEIQDQKAQQTMQLRGTAPWNASRSCWIRYVG